MVLKKRLNGIFGNIRCQNFLFNERQCEGEKRKMCGNKLLTVFTNTLDRHFSSHVNEERLGFSDCMYSSDKSYGQINSEILQCRVGCSHLILTLTLLRI